MDKTIIILSDLQARMAHSIIDENWRHMVSNGKPLKVKFEENKKRRNSEQNAAMWAALEDISEQVDWHGFHLTREEWKDVFTAALKKQKVVPGIDGGFVVVGTSTSQMDSKTFGELLELIHAFGSQNNVKFRTKD